MSKFYNLEGQSVVVESTLDEILPVQESMVDTIKDKLKKAYDRFMEFIDWLLEKIKEAAQKIKELATGNKIIKINLYDEYINPSSPFNTIMKACVKTENDYQKIAFNWGFDLTPLCDDYEKLVIEPLKKMRDAGTKKFKLPIKELSKKVDKMKSTIDTFKVCTEGYKMSLKAFGSEENARPGEYKLTSLKISALESIVHIVTTDMNTITNAVK